MKETKDKKYELGSLSDKKDNRYWRIKLSKISRFNILNRYRGIKIVFNFIEKIIGIIVFAVLLIPISITALVLSFIAKKEKIEETDGEIKNALEAYKRFMEIYPARVYSPVIKSLEVGLLKSSNLTSPILELGIGDGHLSSLVFEGQKHRLAIGSDLIYETILSSKKYNYVDKLAVFDAEEIPLPDNCFNTVIMNNLMHHLPSRKKVLDEVARILKPGGKFIFTDNLYGWVGYTFDSRLLRFFRLDFIARKLEAFKMHLFAQKLLTSSKYWDEAVKESQMEVLVNRDFVSRKAMIISSIFEYLNLLQGQPTRESMKLLLKIGFLGRFIKRKFESIIRYLIINENRLIKDADGAFLFVVLRKKKDSKNINPEVNDLKYVCLKCRKDLISKDNKLICNKCKQGYLIKKSIPILLSYQGELAGFNDYLKRTDKKKVKEYIT